MQYLKQFSIILGISFLSEALNYFIPLPVPASIYGLVLMFVALQLKIVKIEQVEKTADFLLSIMTIFFIPSTVSLIDQWPLLKQYGLQFLAIGIISTIAVFVVAGHVTQLVIRLSSKKTDVTTDTSAGGEIEQ